MTSKFDPFLPPTRFKFPHGGIFSIGTIRCDDHIHDAVYLGYTPEGSDTPSMELELPPKTVDVMIRQLQECANQARYVNGEKMLEYPEPHPIQPLRPRAQPQRRPSRKKKTNNKDTASNADPAKPVANSEATK